MRLTAKRACAMAEGRPAPVAALIALLDELSDVLLPMPIDVYTVAIQPEVSGSIGAHVRHTLDHIAALVSAGRTVLTCTTTASAGRPWRAIPARRCARFCG